MKQLVLARGGSRELARHADVGCKRKPRILPTIGPMLGHGSLSATILLVALSVSGAMAASIPPSSRVIQYRGPMPLLPESAKDGHVQLTFELYRSPTGGVPIWTEARTVAVRDRWVDVDLGTLEPLPDEMFESPFRFLSIWHAGVEFKPRKQVVSVAYVAASPSDYASGSVSPVPASYQSYGDAGTVEGHDDDSAPPAPLGELVTVGAWGIERLPRPPSTWTGAERTAAAVGGRLPTFEEWYAAVDSPARSQLRDIEGHYEWVVPWVYEPEIHARMHELYRGKPIACYYNELSPQHAYAYRLVAPAPQVPSQ